MVKNKGCLTCWPIITNHNKQKECRDGEQLKKHQTSGNAGEITKTKPPPIPKEPDFLESIFPSHRSRTLSSISAPLPSPDWLTYKTQTFRGRTNSDVPSGGTRYKCTSNDLRLMDVVPLTPDVYPRGMSSTLPAGFAGKGGSHNEEEWPEYMWRLDQRRKQICPCSSCTDINKSNEPYMYPTSQFSANFENKSYYNAHDMTECTSSSYERRLGLPPSGRRKMSLPRKGPNYDVPMNNYGSSVVSNRFAFEEEMNELMLSDSPPSRPRAGSYASPIKYVRSQSTGAAAKGGRGEQWPTVSRERRPSDAYDRPKWPAKAVTFAPVSSPAKTRKSTKKCFVCDLKSKATVERRCERQKSIEMYLFNDDASDEESAYVQPDPLGGSVGPESFLYKRVPTTSLPVHSCSGINSYMDCGGKYAYKSVRRQYDATSPDNYLRPLSMKCCHSNKSKKGQEKEKEKEKEKDENSTIGAKDEKNAEENKERGKASLESQKLSIVQKVAFDFHEVPLMTSSYDVPTKVNSVPPELNEVKLSLEELRMTNELELELNEKPSLIRPSQLDLLNLSPPPQCSYMADHSYTNAASSKTNPTSSSKSNKKEAENRLEQDSAETNDDNMKQDELHELAMSAQQNVTYQQQKRPLSSSPYVMLYKKVTHGKDVCLNQLPVLRENVIKAY